MMQPSAAPGARGLRRFVEREPPSATPDPVRRMLDRGLESDFPGERCDMCGASIPESHDHVVHLDDRELLCTCRGCFLLFTHEGAAGGRYRAVPDRYVRDPDFRITQQQWDDVQIPVAMAFVFFNSSLDRHVAFYPSPGGATESLLDLDAWNEVMASNPAFSDVAPDVEALLLNRTDEAFECFLVPIDACYELVAHVRMQWKGFDGGQEAWTAIEGFFEGLRERSRPAVMTGQP